MDRHVPAAARILPAPAKPECPKWQACGFPSEEDMLDWLENQQRSRALRGARARRSPPAGSSSHALATANS